jgi:signal peptidase II
LAGAIGNIIDSIFYGVIFSQSTLSEVATFVPIGHGYTDWLYGKVVDMFYFPFFEFNRPGWMPFIGGDNFIFFSPIFNFADAAISCGVIILLLFYKKYSSDSIHMIKNDLKSKLAS